MLGKVRQISQKSIFKKTRKDHKNNTFKIFELSFVHLSSGIKIYCNILFFYIMILFYLKCRE